MLPFAGTIFISAFLLFQVQPLISRVILPWYGGTPSVWTTCMLFFQAVLLAGYCYAHLLQSLPARKQAIVHGIVLALGVLLCKIMPSESWKPTSVDNPIPSILMLLAANVGVPYFIASTTGPLLQAWFAKQYPGTSPYRLYALSNVGSLLALVTYPAYFERFWTLHQQTTTWSIGFVVFVLFCGFCSWRLYQSSPEESESEQLERMFAKDNANRDFSTGRPRLPAEPPGLGDHILWVVLAACGSTLFLATTNQMLEDIAVVPFLYILPLGLYLLSFILCFDATWWYIRPIWGLLLCGFALGSVEIHAMGSDANIVSQVLAYSAFAFCGCMVCHGELSRLKPAPRYLTAFFLLVSCGGMLGGLFVGVVAPSYFAGYWEFPIALVFVFVCFAAAMIRLSDNVTAVHWLGYTAVVIVGWGIFKNANEFISGKDARDYLFRGRNFFGSLEVYVTDKGKAWEANTLIHGRIEHGFQWMATDKRRWKTTYYGEESGWGLAVTRHPRNLTANGRTDMRLAMVGLGTGTSATYAEKGDYFRFYDINPLVELIARGHFTYLDDAKTEGADIEVLLGDARIVMERQLQNGEKQNFDVIGLDAFSSDAIPAHLLTVECLQKYEQHLRHPNEGIIAIHVSNRYLLLERICRSLANEINMTPIKIENSRDRETGVYTSTWVLLTRNPEFLRDPVVVAAREPWLNKESRLERVWTDDYYNLFDVVEWSKAESELADFADDAPEWVYEKFNDFANKFRRLFRLEEISRDEQRKEIEKRKEARHDAEIEAEENKTDKEQEGFEWLKEKKKSK